jgi:intracellular sulfur oxidation DsrE/DsrF family protein
MAAKVIGLLKEKVEVVACKTSMDVNKMSLFQLLPGVGTVPARKRGQVAYPGQRELKSVV